MKPRGPSRIAKDLNSCGQSEVKDMARVRVGPVLVPSLGLRLLGAGARSLAYICHGGAGCLSRFY